MRIALPERLEGLENELALSGLGHRLVLVLGGELGSRVMRVGRVHDVLHERSAVARFLVPTRSQQVARLERPREVMVVEHRETMSHSVQALKQNPAVRIGPFVRLAQLLHEFLRHLAARHEMRLQDSVITAGLEERGALREHRRDVDVRRVRGDSDRMGVDMPIALHIDVDRCHGLQGRERLADPALAEPGEEVALIAIRLGRVTEGGALLDRGTNEG